MPLPKPPVYLKCQLCGCDFAVQPYRAPSAKFCGWSCKQSAATISRNIKRRGSGVGYVKVNGRHEHRIVAEKMLGRPLLPGEIVHHRNRNKKDNRPENLEVIYQPDHVREHHREMLAARKIKAGY